MKSKATVKNISNARARFDYDLKDDYLAGIVLSGAEVKSLRMGRAHMRGAFISIKDGEAWLNNVQINPTNSNKSQLPEEKQSIARKLLLSKRELAELIKAKDQGLAIVPTKILNKSRYIKVALSTGKGRKKYDKRQSIKARESKVESQRLLKYGR